MSRPPLNLSYTCDEFLGELRTLLADEMEKREIALEKFISRGSLQDIWSKQRLEIFIDLLAPGFVWIRWNDWSNFGTIFFKQDRADCNIPAYTWNDLSDPGFLGRNGVHEFFDARCLFCPIDIVEGENIVCSEEWRLPFLQSSGLIRSGGFGEVAQETIARGHFHPRSLRANGEPSHDTIRVARKRFTTRRDFRDEVKNLSLLHDSLISCTRIVLSLATVTVGDYFNIIFPWADMDLEGFLEGGYRQFPKFELNDLMKEAINLAGALSFLHGGLQPGKRKCRHMDLKPPNILIFAPSSSPVGEWKISDFGISIIDEADQNPTTVSDFVHNKTYPVREELQYRTSTYQPPESSTYKPLGRGSDVWSFGCILMRVLAFGLGGEEELRRFDFQRGLGDVTDRFYRGTPPVLNPHVESWLDTLVPRYPEYSPVSLERYKDLLLRMLSIEKDTRPLSKDIFEELDKIWRDTPPRRSQDPVSDGSVKTDRSMSEGSITATVESLVAAIKNRKIPDLRALLNGRVMVEDTCDGNRPVIYAILHDLPEAVEMLQAYQPELDLETPDSSGNTPLRLASQKGNDLMVKILLDAGVNINTPSQDGLTPLMVAAKCGHGPILSTLLDHGADYMALSLQHGFSALHYAAMNSKAGAEVIRPFIGRVETVDIPSANDQTPFLRLINHHVDTPSWKEKYDILLREGHANINTKDRMGTTPLAAAVHNKNEKVARMLLEQNAAYGTCDLPQSSAVHPGMAKVVREIRAQRARARDVDGQSVRSIRSVVRRWKLLLGS